MAQINFVRQRVKKLSKLAIQDKKIFKLTAIITAIFLLILLGVIGVRFYFLKQLKQVGADQDAMLEEVKSYENRERSFVLFVNKLEVLSKIFLKRQDKQDAIEYFTQVFGPDVVLERIAYDAQAQLLAFGLRAADVFTLERVFQVLSETVEGKGFTEVNKSNLQRTDQGSYQMQITVVLGEVTD